MRRRTRLLVAALPLAVLVGCANTMVARETDALTLTAQSPGDRERELRRFDTPDGALLLSAAASVLQDFGFTLDETNAAAGLLVASKHRDAVEGRQVAGQLVLALLVAAAGGHPDPAWDKLQKIRVSIVTRSSQDHRAIVARVLFQRVIWNTKNQITRLETIQDPIIYQAFFEKLSKATFLTAHEV